MVRNQTMNELTELTYNCNIYTLNNGVNIFRIYPVITM